MKYSEYELGILSLQLTSSGSFIELEVLAFIMWHRRKALDRFSNKSQSKTFKIT